MNNDELLDTRQAAKELTTSEPTMRRMRKENRGPAFVRISERIIRYKRADLREYLKQTTHGGRP